MTTSITYPTELEAAKNLLYDSISIVKSTGVKYILVGGWCPYLRNKCEHTPHPGTQDVDILFEDGDAASSLNTVITAFLSKGYIVSAKHKFQLLKIYQIKTHKVVFNVDILHPTETIKNPQMFVDHLDLDLLENSTPTAIHKFKSIVLPSSRILFRGYYSNLSVDLPDNNGLLAKTKIPVIDWEGLLLTKCESMRSPKRPRDSFDIYLMVCQPNANKLMHKLKILCKENDEYKNYFKKCINYLSENKQKFNDNIFKFDSKALEKKPSPCDVVYSYIRSIVS